MTRRRRMTRLSRRIKSEERPLGNREAVKEYREKKKARAASLEDEVVRLRALNQQLMKRIQSQAGLEAEVKSAAKKSKSVANETDGDKLPTFMFVRREFKQQIAIA
ncbi:putative transcription factor bZIP family [Helianthus annuus]|nr:putative transcription factor bZIP family [Helianthus annuus]KAJ0599717.1 putative transcription factor bZIP family [Helianthus annuus]KAJ0607218.1 putative transcription factor bZIP family [Helianthus annuus]KAJ0767276.1 putative transcription factor bZIP family [Helianthus annuus]KAJ0773122.1 putative transcription factor bZIP family [Helianthus annuus]